MFSTKRLAFIAVTLSVHFNSIPAFAEYFMAKVDLESSLFLAEMRAVAAKGQSETLTLPEEAQLDKLTVIDWSTAISPFRSPFHITLKEFNPSNDTDTLLKPYIESAITKVKFKITGVSFMKKYMALTLDPKYELKDLSSPLSKDEGTALEYFFSEIHPHISLFKIMGNNDTDIAGIKNAWRVETVEEQAKRTLDSIIDTISFNTQALKELSSVTKRDVLDTVHNIKEFLFSLPAEPAAIANVFATNLYNKYKNFFEKRLKIDRSNLDMSDEEMMEAYIKVVFLKMEPETIQTDEDHKKYKVVFQTPFQQDALTVFTSDNVDNRSQGDSKNNFILLNNILGLLNLQKKKTYVGYTYESSKLKELDNWLTIQQTLEGLLKGRYITLSGAEVPQ